MLFVTSGRVYLYLGTVDMSGELRVPATTSEERALCTC